MTGNSVEETITALQSEFLTVEPLDPECYQRYHSALKKAREEKGEVSIVLVTLKLIVSTCLS